MPVTAKHITLDEAVSQLEKKQPAKKPVTLDEAATDLLKKNASVGGVESSQSDSQLGLVEKGNINLFMQPSVKNPETGGESTVYSMSIGTDKGEVLISRVTPDGRILSEKDAIDYYKQTGKHLGVFKNVLSANIYAEKLHQDYAKGVYKPLPGSPLEVEDQPTRFDASFLDRDIDRQFETSLSNPELFKPANKYSLRNLYYESQKAKFDERRDLAMSEVKQDTKSLTAYNNRRISEINQDIKTDTDAIKDIVKAQGYGASDKSLTDETNRLYKQVWSAQAYKNKLKASIGNEAVVKIVPEFVAKDVFDAGELGREIIKVADPETEQQYQEAEKLGSGLPPIQAANMERLGLDVAKDYLQRLPETEATKAKLADIEAHEKSFDERNPDIVTQRAREKLAVWFYNQGKGGFFGYSDRNILKAINDPATLLTDSEKKAAMDNIVPVESKLFFSTEIPGSGFFRGGKNAIERSLLGTLNTINSGVVTGRTDPQRAYENLNQEIEGSRFRQPGESPSLKYELYGLINKEQTGAALTAAEQTQKTELEKLVNVRSWNSKLMDGVGDLTGQVIQMALLTKGVGAVGKLATAFGESGGLLTGGMTSSAIGTALSNNTVGLFINSFFQSYDNYRSQALQLMPGEANAANRKAYALTMAGFEGVSERFFNDVKILKAFSKNIAPTVQDITSRFINKEITREVAGEELKSAVLKYIKPFKKAFIKSEVEESFEEGSVDLADGLARSFFLGQPFDLVKTGKQSLNTFLTTALNSPLVATAAAVGHARASGNISRNAFYKAAIVDMGISPHKYLEVVENLKLNGTIDQDQANEKIQLIKAANKYLYQIPTTFTYVKKENGETKLVQRELDYPDVASYLVHRLNEGVLQEELDKTTDKVDKNNLQGEIDRSVAIRQGLADGSLGVTDDIQEVTDDPKKANELGINHVSDVTEDELVNTKYMPKPVDEKVVEEKLVEATPDVTQLFSTPLLGEKKLDFIEWDDPATGQIETITARSVQLRSEKRHTLLQTFIECYTKQ